MARRLTREESRSVTRTRLLESAADVFAEKGFNGASVEEIAARAGYTRGAFYSNFTGKDVVFLALLDERFARGVDEVREIIRGSESSQELIAGLRARAKRRGIDVPWLLLFSEFQLYAIRNPRVRPELARRARAEREALAKAFTHQYEAAGFEPPAPPGTIGLILQIIDRGCDIEHVLDPEDVPADAYFDALDYLTDAGFALASPRARAGRRRRT